MTGREAPSGVYGEGPNPCVLPRLRTPLSTIPLSGQRMAKRYITSARERGSDTLRKVGGPLLNVTRVTLTGTRGGAKQTPICPRPFYIPIMAQGVNHLIRGCEMWQASGTRRAPVHVHFQLWGAVARCDCGVILLKTVRYMNVRVPGSMTHQRTDR